MTDQFKFSRVVCDEVARIVRSIPANKSSVFDKIPVRVIKDSIPATLTVITSLIDTFSPWNISSILQISCCFAYSKRWQS